MTSLTLSPHPTARNTARTTRSVARGSKLLSERALCLVLLPDEKGRRCDACCRQGSAERGLRKCTGCASYWYCGERCQAAHWRAEHKALCSEFARYIASNAYSVLDERERMDGMLLSGLVAYITLTERSDELVKLLPGASGDDNASSNITLDPNPNRVSDATLDSVDPLETFADLLPSTSDKTRISVPPTCPLSSKIRKKHKVPSSALVRTLYSRFSNNNFVIHASDLSAIAHGIFPRASRVFNHSCTPNAWAVYGFREREGVGICVRAGKALNVGEEVTVPYLDAALPYKRRQEICRYSYGFTCTCQSCSLEEQLDKAYGINKTPEDASVRAQLDSMMYHFVLQNSLRPQATPTPTTPLSSLSFPYRLSWPTDQLLPHLPQALLPILHETYLPTLSSAFRTAAHDGPIEEALRTGRTLLAYYEVAYPPMYPQTALHCLELCKVSWNATIQLSPDTDPAVEETLKSDAKHYLDMARQALSISGYFEGDAGGEEEGPRAEIEVLESLLARA